jgi:hypothetical protein
MVRPSLALTALLVCGAPLLAQRGGRADALQNCLHDSQHDSILLLQIRVENRRAYFKPSDLRKMPRSVLILPDPSTGISHKYEGVALEHLLSAPPSGLQFSTLEISYGHQQKKTILGSAVDSHSGPLVVDTIDGEKLTGYVPYFLVFLSQGAAGPTQPLQNVDLISVKTSPR